MIGSAIISIPTPGKQITLRNYTDRTTGFDLNFRLPKSVSLAYTIGRDERILEAFCESVEETMPDVEQDRRLAFTNLACAAIADLRRNAPWAHLLGALPRQESSVTD